MGQTNVLEWKVMMKSDIAIEVGNIYVIMYMYMWFDICSKHVTLLKVWLVDAHCKV
jgi:hypothetical protein